jgi:hypothetical protein
MPSRGRDTTTGSVLEQMVYPALEKGGYHLRRQVEVGVRPGGGKHFVDVLAERQGLRTLISLKWQQVSGTAEQKIPYEIICLADALTSGNYNAAYLVLGGPGWKLRKFYTEGGLQQHLIHASKVSILDLETFIGRANMALL